ncbi:MAG: Sir2 family NAD-dependent protein deacetylase [Clostridia bacterium]
MGQMLDALRSAAHPLALTGAGISAPSGVPTFQSLWKGRPMRDALGREDMERDPVGFFELYCAMEAWSNAQPNAAHRQLAAYHVPILTQNIDGLHQKAGSREVVELHGNLRRVFCKRCGWEGESKTLCQTLRPLYATRDTKGIERTLRCRCGAPIDMDVVLYGDAVRGLDTVDAWLSSCDVLLVIGTSLTTYPAAALPDIARQLGARVLMANEDCIAALTEEEL